MSTHRLFQWPSTIKSNKKKCVGQEVQSGHDYYLVDATCSHHDIAGKKIVSTDGQR
jgi:hypothetical protein